MDDRTADLLALYEFLQDLADAGKDQRYLLYLLRDGADMVVGWCSEDYEVKYDK